MAAVAAAVVVSLKASAGAELNAALIVMVNAEATNITAAKVNSKVAAVLDAIMATAAAFASWLQKQLLLQYL
jgi:hypothetical protein